MEGTDPNPTPAHPLVVQSHELDAAVAVDGGLLEALQRDQKRQDQNALRTNVTIGVLIVVIVAVIVSLFAVSENASKIENERRARHVFCEETNINNADARVALIHAFPNTTNPAAVRDIATQLFPLRDCTKDPPIVLGSIDVSDLPDPPPTTG